jgi:hypothetical protein
VGPLVTDALRRGTISSCTRDDENPLMLRSSVSNVGTASFRRALLNVEKLESVKRRSAAGLTRG